MRRWLGDLLRSAANHIDPPKPIHITPLIIRPDGRAVANTVHAAIPRRTPPPRWIERVLGHIFGWL